MAVSADRQEALVRIRQAARSNRRLLRILCVNYEYPPMGGGAGNATRYTARELLNRGHAVHVLTSRLPDQSDLETEDGLAVFRARSRRINLHQAGLKGAASFLPGALARLRKLAKAHNYDIYHFYFGLPTGILALYVHWVLKKPYVIALRGSDVPGYDNTRWYLRPLHSLLAPLSRFLWSRAAAVTALSDNLRQLAQSAVPGVPIELIGNGIDSKLFARQPRQAIKKDVRLLCVCRLVRRKGLEHLVSAMRELSKDGMTLDIIGIGECQSRLQAWIDEFGVGDSVRLVGYVPREQLAEHYNAADIFVLPSLSESFGQVLLEAMSCGLPIVATRVGGVPETVHSEVGGLLIQPASSEAIVGAVRTLAANPRRRTSMGQYNRRLAENYYQWARVAESYESLYLKCLDESPAASVAAT